MIDRIDFADLGPIGVSTVNTVDHGPETCLFKGDNGGSLVVERYLDREQAQAGHDRWAEAIAFVLGEGVTK